MVRGLRPTIRKKRFGLVYVTQLILKIPVVILFTAKFKTQNSYLLSTKNTYGLRTDLRTNNDYSFQSNDQFLSKLRKSVYCAVRTESLNITPVNLSLQKVT